MKEQMSLPPYPQPVTDVIPATSERSPEVIVSQLLKLPVVDLRYQRDQYGTKCNFFTCDYLHLMNVPVETAKANDLGKRWTDGADAATIVSVKDAVQAVNQGRPTVGFLYEEPHGHVFPLLPQPDVDDPRKLIIANVGAANFYGRQLVYAMSSKKCLECVFVVFP